MINWYPGHIAKAKRNIKKQLPFIDLIIELIDARLPASTYLSEVEDMIQNKNKIILLNKADLAEPARTDYWLNYYKNKGFNVLACNVNNNKSVNEIKTFIKKQAELILGKLQIKGIKRQSIRTMVIGIPNIGKSSLINKLVQKKAANVANKPGVTKQSQWIRISNEIELLDTPGLFYPDVKNDPDKILKFVLIGAIPIDFIDLWNMALDAIVFLKKIYPDFILQEFGEEPSILAWGEKQNFKSKGNNVDKERTVKSFIQYIQSGKFRRFTFE